MTTALERGEGSASRPGRSLSPGKTRYPLYRRLGGPQGRSGQVRKISPPPGFDPQIAQTVASGYTDYATQPSRAVRKRCNILSMFIHCKIQTFKYQKQSPTRNRCSFCWSQNNTQSKNQRTSNKCTAPSNILVRSNGAKGSAGNISVPDSKILMEFWPRQGKGSLALAMKVER
jgi:hypothetical protein